MEKNRSEANFDVAGSYRKPTKPKSRRSPPVVAAGVVGRRETFPISRAARIFPRIPQPTRRIKDA
jgi:hypothetical protein